MSNTMKTGEFCWNELLTPDVAKAKAFYSALFGWQITDHDMGNMVYSMFNNGDKEVGGMMTIPEGQNIPPHWMSYVYVEDLDASAKKAETLGAKIVQPPTDVGNFGRLAVLQDPTGAHIALWQSVKSA